MTVARVFRALSLAAVLAAAGGCAIPEQTREVLESRERLALPRTAINERIPFIPQEDLYCGPAATAMAMNTTGMALTQEEAAAKVYTPGREGTRRSDIVSAVRRWGRFGTPVRDLTGIMREAAVGNPVIVFQNLALDFAPQWHYAVVVGYDLNKAEMVLHSGTRRDYRMPMSTFEHTWARGDYWGLAVTRADQLPATATEDDALAAAAGIARAGNAEAAVTAFRSVAERWPKSYAARMGLGNAYYAVDRPREAAEAFREAAAMRKDAPEPWNNLAYALRRQGDEKAARDAAREAVERAPADPRFRETLKEISRAP